MKLSDILQFPEFSRETSDALSSPDRVSFQPKTKNTYFEKKLKLLREAPSCKIDK